MKFFLDTTNLDDIRAYQSFGLIDGVTTNPSLMSKSDKGFYETAVDLCKEIEGDVSIEVVSSEYNKMIEEGTTIASMAKNAVIKLPMTWDGIRACHYFSSRDFKVNMTLCFSANQALIAAKAGAKYVSPFIGRLDDIGKDGINLIREIRYIYNNYNMQTNILAASIRTTEHVKQAAICGADYITMPPALMHQLIEHELTTKGLEIFEKDWLQSGKNFTISKNK